MRKVILLFAFMIITSGALNSCSVSEDDFIENPILATGDEVDDPVEPDEDGY